jgi:hypothetical protein
LTNPGSLMQLTNRKHNLQSKLATTGESFMQSRPDGPAKWTIYYVAQH